MDKIDKAIDDVELMLATIDREDLINVNLEDLPYNAALSLHEYDAIEVVVEELKRLREK